MNDKRQELAQINKAIETILKGGQSYRIGSRSLTRADLAILRSMKNEIEQQITNENPKGKLGNTTVGFFDRR